ncbi:MAG: DUF4159 domain-containing protein [Hyphomicrobiales bacterium]
MTLLGPLGFVAPLALLGLFALPAIWWLLRATPPRPREEVFPPTRLLARLARREETPARSPWWLTALRLVLAALIVLALAGPVLHPAGDDLAGSGPLVLVIDNGWSSAADWPDRMATASRLLDAADRADRPVVLAPTAAAGPIAAATDAATAREHLAALAPASFTPDRAALADALATALGAGPAEIVWIADGLENGGGQAFAERLKTLAGTPLVYGADNAPARGLVIAGSTPEALRLTVERVRPGPAEAGSLRALDLKGRLVAEQPFALADGAVSADVEVALPIELRNEIARLEIAGEKSAGAVQLLDERWRRRTVGLVSGETSDVAQPLLSPLYYVEKALAPFADLRKPRAETTAEAVAELVDGKVSMIVLTDVGTLAGETATRLAEWIAGGGTLVRFAGPRLGAANDVLVPVRLRAGDRTLGGSLTWEKPQGLAPFPAASPFAGLAVPADVAVARQVLAEPSPDLIERTWAELADGTPLVTAARSGAGRIILFHVTADTTWSNLPLSGTFVEMLRRVTALSTGTAGKGEASSGNAGEAPAGLAPLRLLDGFGAFTPPTATAEPLPPSFAPGSAPDIRHPPGFYGTEDAFRAVNVLAGAGTLVPLDIAALDGIEKRSISAEAPRDLRPALLLAAFVLALADLLAILAISGTFAGLARRAAIGLALALVAAPVPEPRAEALAPADQFALEATRETHLAFVLTGNPAIDEASRAGLAGLSRFIAARTSLEPGEPMAVDPARDDLTFFPLVYWPIDPAAPLPEPAAIARIDGYMKHGGTVLFDTRDALTALPGRGIADSPAGARLAEMLAGLDIPPLAPVPGDHVLTKTFYLLDEFPGRYRDGALWVEALPEPKDAEDRPARAGDGVASILITGNDFAGAWAEDDAGRPLYATVPGDERQRELAFRAGANIVMYTLTGNYKADQVHIPSLLERLGQ